MSTYYEERRKDRAHNIELRIKERRELRNDRKADRDERDARRAAQRAAVIAAAKKHAVHLLLVPGIVVPAVLAWTAMADYGSEVFGGGLGWGLPLFSEGTMWAFAAATTITRHRRPDAPVWHLQLGTAVFAFVAAVLNLMHGFHLSGLAAGIVMALVSIGGVVAHQLVTAGPRRTRAERADAAIARQAARRAHRVRRAVVARSVATVDESGRVDLIFRPATVTLKKPRWFPWFRRPIAVDAVVPGLVPADQGPALDDDLAGELTAFLASPEADRFRPAPQPAELYGPAAADPRFEELLALARTAIATGDLSQRPSRRALSKFLSVRAELAAAIGRALKDDNGGGETPVPAH